MSGIGGIVWLDRNDADVGGLESMLRAAPHRGPDGQTSWTGEGAALGHLAFDVNDADRLESQPVQGLAGRYVVVADGRVDGQAELLSSLRSRDQRLGSAAGPATLLLNAYLAWGEGFMQRVLGDWAFALWDRVDRRLLLARSPLGLRPLYYRIDEGRIVFGSEIGQILALDGMPRRLFLPMAGAWLLNEPGAADWSIFEGIQQLPGGYFLDATPGTHRVSRGWNLDPDRTLSFQSDADYAEAFRDILISAVADRLSSGRVAMLLSGGLDSCAVAAASGSILGRERTADRLITLSYRYEGFPECDERHVSGPLAHHWGMRVEEIASTNWSANWLLRCDWGVDSPAVGIYRPLEEAAMRRARELDARQILIAARGDNMMGGNIWDPVGLLVGGRLREGFGEVRTISKLRGTGFWATLRRQLARSSSYWVRCRAPRATERLRTFRLGRASAHSHRAAPPWVTPALIEALPAASFGGSAPRNGFGSLARGRRFAAVSDVFTELGCGQTARRAAVNHLQYDDPWSDRRIVEFVCAVPQHVLNRADDRKRLTRMALGGLVPPAVQREARKILPATFGDHVLRANEAESLRTLTSEMLSARAGLVDESALQAHVETFLAGGSFDSEAWTAITLEAWLRSNEVEVSW